jgi:DsbC/DsbD-like thiol-disulfide interchange protein
MLTAAVRPMLFRLTIVAFPLVWLASIAPAQAQDASAWQSDGHAAARLIAGATVKTPGNSFVRAGVEIRLEPGWKTYWRYPGDSGAPPTFSFDGSKNVKSVTVQWPAPERLADGAGGYSIGYAGDVILPLEVTPTHAGQPSLLRMAVNYAVCGTLCIPARAALALTLTGDSADEAILQKAEQRVPKRVALGPLSGHALAVLSVQREAGGNHKKVAVEIAAPVGAPVQLFAEGPSPEWALPLPEPASPDTGATRRFTFDLDGLPPGAHAKGATLTLTAVSGDDAIEVPARLD